MKKLFLVSLLFVATNIFAQSAALTLSVTNKVVAKMKNTERKLNRGAALNVKDNVITSVNSLATLKYTNGTIVDLGEKTRYQILSYQPKQSDITIRAEIYSGKMHSKTSGRLKETLKTPVVALSILGTDYNVYVASPTKVYVKVNQGQVMARNKIIRAGESYVITPTRMYPTPFPQEGYVTYRAQTAMNASQGGSAAARTSAAGGTSGSTTLAQANARSAQCQNGAKCDVDYISRYNIDVIDTSLFLGVTTTSVAGTVALVS